MALTSSLSMFPFSVQLLVDKMLRKILRRFICVLCGKISEPLNFILYPHVLSSYPTIRPTTYSVGVSLKFGSLAWFEEEREIFGVGYAIACSWASLARCMDTVLCMPFLLMVNVCLLSHTICKGLVLFDVSLSSVAVAILWVPLVAKAVRDGF